MALALKILFFLSVASAAAFASMAARGLARAKLLPWLALGKERVAFLADRAGIDLKPAVCTALAPICPAVAVIFSALNRRRLVKIDSQLSDALALLGNALKSGLSLSQAIETASIEVPKPLRPELERVARQLKLGRTVEDALAILADRVPTDDVGLIVQSVEVLRRTGGNLIETFGTLAATIEGRRKVEDRIRVLTAQGIYQGVMLLVMPWALGLLLHLMAPDYLEPLLGTRLGLFLIALGVALEAAGAFWLKRIVMIRV